MTGELQSLRSVRSVAALRSGADALETHYRSRPEDFDALRREHFPQREPRAHELVAELGRRGSQLSRAGFRLLLARTLGHDSWGQAESSVAVHEPELAAFRDAVFTADHAAIERSVRSAAARAEVDSPWFHFDAPAIVQCKQDLRCVDALLAAGADIDRRSDWWAGGFGVLDGVDGATARELIARGAKLDAAAAAELGWLEELERVVNGDPGAATRPAGDGQQPLHRAATEEIASFLLQHGADLDARCVDHESTPAQYLIRQHPEVSRFLVDRGARCDLFLAVALGEVGRVLESLQAEPSSVSYRIGRAPYAAVSRDHGGHIYQWTLGHGLSPLDLAHERGNEEIWQLLFQACSIPKRIVACSFAGRRAEALGLAEGSRGWFEELTHEDRTLLAWAAWQGDLEAVGTLLDLGFDPHLRGAEESTPLDRASFRGHHRVVELLLERDPEPPLEWRNAYGGTPLAACLHAVREFGRKEPDDWLRTAELLLRAGAEVDHGWLPTGIARLDRLLRRS